jgi:hypothetical protein
MNNNEKKVVVWNSDNIPQQYMQQLASLRSLVKEKIGENLSSTDYNTQNNDNSNQSSHSRHGSTQQFTFVHVSSVHVSKNEVVQPKEGITQLKEEMERQKAKERINRILKEVLLVILHIFLFRGHSCCDCR